LNLPGTRSCFYSAIAEVALNRASPARIVSTGLAAWKGFWWLFHRHTL